MKSLTLFYVAIGFLILVIAWFIYSSRNQDVAQVFPATIDRDCAPWDGSAFTVAIPSSEGTIINVSIWQSPDIKLPVTFSFPDETGQIGFAYILTEPDHIQELGGEVSFSRVEEGILVEGEFNLTNESGEQFRGRFKADWGNQVVYCG